MSIANFVLLLTDCSMITDVYVLSSAACRSTGVECGMLRIHCDVPIAAADYGQPSVG